jgi:aspartyl-tRNA(Asn)/glutamyl-tRNA(Gln) amidotransferase subunit B
MKVEPIFDLESLVDEVLTRYPEKVLEYKSGSSEAFEFLVKEILKFSQGKANPIRVRALLVSKI